MGHLRVRLPYGCRAPVGQQLWSNEALCDATDHSDKQAHSGSDQRVLPLSSCECGERRCNATTSVSRMADVVSGNVDRFPSRSRPRREAMAPEHRRRSGSGTGA